MTTLTDLAKQLHDIADQLTALSEAIVKAHTDLGGQLQAAVTTENVKPQAPLAPTEKGDVTSHG